MSAPCKIIRDLLPLYCDGVCSEESRKLVEEHLQSCEACKKDQQIMSVDAKTVSVHANDKKIAKAAAVAWKKGKRKAFLIGFLIALSAVLILVGTYAGFHWFSSVAGDDLDALARQAADYFGTSDLFVAKTVKRGNYLATLCTNSNGKWFMCEYERDKMFENRWFACGGKRGFDPGEIKSWNYGSPQGDAIIIFSGAELSDDARWYTFQNNGITYTCPIENNTVLDIFIVLDGRSSISAVPTALDKNQQPLQGNSSLSGS